MTASKMTAGRLLVSCSSAIRHKSVTILPFDQANRSSTSTVDYSRCLKLGHHGDPLAKLHHLSEFRPVPGYSRDTPQL
jgi:hypothetical protein